MVLSDTPEVFGLQSLALLHNRGHLRRVNADANDSRGHIGLSIVPQSPDCVLAFKVVHIFFSREHMIMSFRVSYELMVA